ncbi:MAG TPA: RecX family transcriptional regulator [Nitrospiraceae bacterium]|nr:RecX family transcriptional regulator [Nitrospiraceae bacterium]
MSPRRPRRSNGRSGDAVEPSVLRYLARRDRTEAQVKAYLERLGAAPARTRTLIARYRSLGYLNDQAYAARWVRRRLERRPMGRARLEAELIGQGIDPATTARTLDLVYGEISERDLARIFLARKPASAGMLRRHGFSEETIEAVFSPGD